MEFDEKKGDLFFIVARQKSEIAEMVYVHGLDLKK